MPREIRLSADDLNLMSIFHAVSGASPRDCIVDEQMNRIIFIVSPGEMAKAIGKKGAHVQQMERLMGRPVEVVEYAETPESLVKKALGEKYVSEVRVVEKLDGRRSIVAVVSPKNKKFVIGRGGRNVSRARLICQRYFEISDIQVVTQA